MKLDTEVTNSLLPFNNEFLRENFGESHKNHNRVRLLFLKKSIQPAIKKRFWQKGTLESMENMKKFGKYHEF